MLVDDEPLLVDTARDMLGHLGYKVTATDSATEALRIFSADPEKFTAVITDQAMPELTGLELARAMRLSRPSLPVVIATEYSNVVSADIVKAMGRSSFVKKPYARASLGVALREAMSSDFVSLWRDNVGAPVGWAIPRPPRARRQGWPTSAHLAFNTRLRFWGIWVPCPQEEGEGLRVSGAVEDRGGW